MSTTYYVKVYPNPTNDKLNIEAPKGISVNLVDLQGRLLLQQKEADQIDMSQYATGVYILQFVNSDNEIIAVEKISKVD